ncbi:MAG TPA: phenylalanine--tRNA ligase subunit beta [Candidatus Dormibacteraeota bacterium]|nr:phenylalanine--tRNA ligase subunit beta [Candidatus Dormibacteraeota bacterium]
MKVLYNWLKEFVEFTAPASDVRSRLSMAGVSVDSVEETPAGPVLDAEITINRPDLLGHLGIAREIATLYRLDLKWVHPKFKESPEPASKAARVEIESPDLCGRYTARIIRGVKIQPSPDWLRLRLEALGQSSINNVVDITNYVMLELGQPLHAFDYDHLAEHRIVVRRARPGETMRTLDGIERKLTKDMCLICDARSPVAIGGVMGGAESEISFSTKNLLLESAWFDPISIRRTSKALALRTEASMRFERGVDIELADMASRRAAEVIQQLAGGDVLAGVMDVYPHSAPPQKIELSRKELLRIMGADVPDRAIEEILSALGFAPRRIDANRGSAGSLVATWECTLPSWRGDVTREVDIIEEIARHYGYDKFPPRLPPAKQPAARLPYAMEEDRLRERLVALGYQEIVAIPLVDPERDAVFRHENVTAPTIANPLSEDASTMRTSGITSMIGALEWNLNHGQRNLRLFEFGKAYEVRAGKPVETRVLTLGATGLAREQAVHEAARDFSFDDLKGELDQILALAAGAQWKLGGGAWLATGRAAEISVPASNGKSIGFAGLLARSLGQRFKLRQEVYLAELRLEPLAQAVAHAHRSLRYEPLPRFPAVERDFSLVLADATTFAQVEKAIHAANIPELRRIEAIDLFRGGQISAGKYSLLVRVTFQSDEATFTEAQLTDFSARIVSALTQKLGASLRAV